MKQNIKNNLIRRRGQSGFTGADVLIAIAIITLFTGIITTISYNIYLATISTQRMSKANSYIAQVFEYADEQYYDKIALDNETDISKISLVDYFNGKYNTIPNLDSNSTILASATTLYMDEGGKLQFNSQLNTPYQIGISVQSYIPPEEDNPLDLVKIITIDVRYKVGNKQQDVVMTKVKQRETLITPNPPDISMIPTALPVKYDNDVWVRCETKDTRWYNYNNGYWATAFVANPGYSAEAEMGQPLTIDDLSNGHLYVWIPRYAYLDTDISFIYGISDKCVSSDSITSLADIPGGYTIPLNFNDGINKLKGIWVNETDSPKPAAYNFLNNSSEYKIKNHK